MLYPIFYDYIRNSDLSQYKDKNSSETEYNPSNTGYTTLSDFIGNVLIPSKLSYYTFLAIDFTDLPIMEWGFSVEYTNCRGGIYVKAYKHLSNGEIFIRGMGMTGWAGEWKKINLI